MKNFTNRALATAFAVSLILGSASVALADRGVNGHGNGHSNTQGKSHAKAQGKSHAKASVHAKSSVTVHGNNSNNGNKKNNQRNSNVSSGNSATAHSCINPAGNTRGWCKSHMNGSFITGTVTSINGNTALITQSNGQQVTINATGRNLTVGQQITLRGNYGSNNVFDPTNGNYSNYGGPYSGASVRGLIISVSGNSVQIVQGLSLITVNDANAASSGAINGSLYPGRTITAYGSWSGSTFVATSIQ